MKAGRMDWATRAAGAATLMAAASAGAVEPASVPASAPAPQRVTIDGSYAINDDRREANAAKTIVSHDDIARFGDSNLLDVLRRVPGVTIGKSKDDGSAIRLRGLGDGYTQLLLDGEPAPPGFSIDSLSPDLIERIEVIRTATADQSTQAIAGTVNIVLKHSARRKDRNIKLVTGATDGVASGSVAADVGDQAGAATWSISANGAVDRDRRPTTTTQRVTDGRGVSLYDRSTRTVDTTSQWSASLAPHVGWKWSETQLLSLDGLVQYQHSRLGEIESRRTLDGTPPVFAGDSLDLPSDSLLIRVTGRQKSDWATAGQLDQKLTGSVNHRSSDGLRRFFDDPGQDILDRRVTSQLRDGSDTWTGKYLLDLGDSQTLGTGWDGQLTRRTEDRVQVEASPTGYPTNDFAQGYTAQVQRLALYAQDEVAETNGVSFYGGVRWETLRTRVTGQDFTPVAQKASVFSPTMQLTWKIPGSKSDQVRTSLGRTYKAPTAKDLIPRLWLAPDNSATTPDFEGNPSLRPQLAWAFDIAYEHYFHGDGLLSLSGYAKRIDDVVLQQLFRRDDGSWTTTPYNGGRATAAGVELELKAKFADLVPGAPDGDLRLSIDRNWSRVDSVPGPDNRLDDQAPLTVSLGIDHRPRSEFWWGIGVVHEQRYTTRESATQTVTNASKNTFDVYALWKFDRRTQLRATLSRLLGPDDGQRSRYADSTLDLTQQTNSPWHYGIKLQLQHAL